MQASVLAALSATSPQLLPIPQTFALACRLHQAHQLMQAEDLLKKILQLAPKHAPALHLLGVIAHQSGNTVLGIQFLKQAVEISSNDATFCSNLGEMYRINKQIDEAISIGEKAVSLNGASATTHSNLGIAYYDKGELDNAQACQQRALEIDPHLPAALNNLGSICRDKKDKLTAIAYYRKVIAVAPNYIESVSNLGSALTENDQAEEAIKLLLSLIQAHPNFADAHCNIATAFLMLEQFDKAEFGFKRALELRPAYPEAFSGLARVLQEQRKLTEALAMAERSKALAPYKPEVYSLLGGILSELAYPDKAAQAYAQALALDANSVGAYLGRGHLLMEKGDIQGAKADFEHALSLDKDSLGARLALAQVEKVTPDSDNMAALILEASKLDTLPETKIVPLHFALGKCYEDSKQYDLAFEHYHEGCRLKRKHIAYSADNTALISNNIREFFTKETIDRLRGDGCDSELPIFVLGMPRSGTTLTETIIASHPMVYGAGELHDMVEITSQALNGNTEGYPLNMPGITQVDLKFMGRDYVSRLQARAPHSPRITDKMPANFNYLGLIHLMLPKAKIVHVKRNPIDTCVSCYTRLFNRTQYQSYDLSDIGRYYRSYAELMAHWHKVLPAGAFYEIQYEDLVSDQEGQARALLNYCGLPWHDACLDFHKTERNIRTASVTQVRQPIYKSSVEKWRHYERHLGPLLEALGSLVPE